MRLHYEVIGAAVAIFIVGPIVWMALDRDVPVHVVAVERLDEHVERGGPLHPRYQVEWTRRCSGWTKRKFVDSANVEHEDNPYEFRDGIGADGRPIALNVIHATPLVVAAVPYGASPGRARMQATSRFYCNPLQKMLGPRVSWLGIDFRYPVIEFAILPTAAASIAPPSTIFAPVMAPNGPADVSESMPMPPSDDKGKLP